MKLKVTEISQNFDGTFTVVYKCEDPLVSLLMRQQTAPAIGSEWEFTEPTPLRQKEDFEVYGYGAEY